MMDEIDHTAYKKCNFHSDNFKKLLKLLKRMIILC